MRDDVVIHDEQVITNARLVTPDGVVQGNVLIRAGRIEDVAAGHIEAPGAVDCDGDYLVPGLIDIHTDNFEKQLEPRPKVHWPALSALLTHDRQVIAAGITTVLDALAVGFFEDKPGRREALIQGADLLACPRTRSLLKAEHLLHLRAEVSTPTIVEALEAFIGNPLIRMVSVMDHTPGQRQWADLTHWRTFYSKSGKSHAELDALLDQARANHAEHAVPNRIKVVDLAKRHGLPLASHDDTTPDHVEEALAEGIDVSEFPTTLDAARLAAERGMRTVMGGPNVVMGGSHSGNVAAEALAEAGVLHGLASDYVPSSMLHAAFILARDTDFDLPAAIHLVSGGPADMLGLTDRGAITPGKRADLVRVREHEGVPAVISVWREGVEVI